VTEREALDRAVLEHPEDDVPRLAMASWLDDNGEQDRAEFVRVQVELSRMNDYGGGKAYGEKRDELRSRELALFAAHGAEWFGPEARMTPSTADSSWHPDDYRIVPARGFPAHWYGTWSKWVGGVMSYEERSAYACAVCGNAPDEDGHIEHGRGCFVHSDDGGGSSWIDLPNNGRIPGACETLSWRKGWDMECGACKGKGGWSTGPHAEDCRWCHGSGRVDRPVPSGAVPLETVTLTTIPTRFYKDSATWKWVDDPENQPWWSVEQAKNACQERWKGLHFHLPSEQRETPNYTESAAPPVWT
jgi:uncharacterized protein (TIGR02996 family)